MFSRKKVSQKKLEENYGANPIKTMDNKETAEMNKAFLDRHKNKREAISKFMGSGGVKKSIYCRDGSKFTSDKGDKITNTDSNILNNAISTTNKEGRRFVRKHPGGYIVTGNKVSYC